MPSCHRAAHVVPLARDGYRKGNARGNKGKGRSKKSRHSGRSRQTAGRRGEGPCHALPSSDRKLRKLECSAVVGIVGASLDRGTETSPHAITVLYLVMFFACHIATSYVFSSSGVRQLATRSLALSGSLRLSRRYRPVFVVSRLAKKRKRHRLAVR